MRFHEIMFEAKLPGRVANLLNKPIPIVLKSGRDGQLLITRGQETRVLHGGLSVTATVDNQHAASMSIYPNRVPDPQDRGSWSVNNLHVNDEFRRQGIATAMYDTLAKAGMKILPSGQGYGGKLLPGGTDLWRSNRTQRFWTPK